MRAARRSEREQRRRTFAVGGVCGLAAFGAALAPGAATQHPVVDVLWRVGLAVAVTLAATRARAWTSILTLGIALLVATQDTATFLVVLAVFGAAVALAVLDRTGPLVGAVVGAATVQVVLRLPAVRPVALGPAVLAVGVGAIVVSGVRRSSPTAQRAVWRVSAFVGGTALIAVLLLAAVVILADDQLQTGVDAARAGIDAARKGDTQLAIKDFDRARQALTHARSKLDTSFVLPARAVPIVAQHEHALQRLVDNAESLVSVGDRSAHEADVQSLRVVQGRVDPARVTRMRAPLERVSVALRQSEGELERLDTSWLVPPLHDAVDTLTRDVRHARGSAITAELAVTAAPRLLGTDAPQHYFIAFTTPSEARGGGGLMGNWGVLTVTDGRFELSAFGRTEELNAAGDAATKQILGPSDYLARYARFSPATEWRNVNMSPDFPSVADVVRQLYPQSGGGPIDGVIALDPDGLAALLELTGPVVVPGRTAPLTAKNAARFLLRDQYTEFGTSARIDFLSDAAHTVTDRLTHANLPGPKTIGQVLATAARGGHLQMHSFDRDGERLFRRLGAEQVLQAGSGDAIGLVTQNASGNKVDLFLHRAMHVESTVDPSTGEIHSTVTVTLRNDAPTGGLPDYVIGNPLGLPAGTNRLSLSLYTPLNVARTKVGGVSAPFATEVERGLNVYSKFITIPPRSSVTLRFELVGRTRFVPTANGPAYRLDVLHQIMVNPDRVDISVRLAKPWSFGDAPKGFTVRVAAAGYRRVLERTQELTAPIDGARVNRRR